MLAGVATVGHDGAQTYVNRAMAEMVGWTREELIGAKPPYAYWPPEEIANIEAAFRRTLAGDAPRDGFELRFCRKSGERFDVLVLISELRDGGEAHGWLASVYDVTERKRIHDEATRARAEAEASTTRLRVLGEASEALAQSLDGDAALRVLADVAVARIADYCITYALDLGTRAVRRVGLRHRDPGKQELVEQLVAAGPPSIGDAYGAGAVIRTAEAVMASEIPDEMIAMAAQNEEHARVLRALSPRSSVVAPLVARGRTIGAIAVATTDDSGRRYGEDDRLLVIELARRAALLVDNARLYVEARDAARARDELVAMVSHDLRNPTQTILAACDLLDGVASRSDDIARTAAIIRRAAGRLQHFAGDLLDVARIENGALKIDRQPLEVSALLGDACSHVEAVATSCGVQIERLVPDGLPHVLGDRMRLLQVVVNLLGNALKYVGHGGRVIVKAERHPSCIRIAVDDTGRGIAEEQLVRVFDRFWQADGTHQGVGLGLAIAKGIVEAHGGTIGVKSAIGVGSTFWFTLPHAE